MRQFGRGLILAALLCASAPSVVGAAPLLLQTDINKTDCTAIGSANPGCSIYDLGSLVGTQLLDLTFEYDADVALFAFSIDADSSFLALTTSETIGLDSILGLFDATTQTLYGYTDPNQSEVPIQARGTDIDMFGNFNDQLGGFTLAAGTTYYLAVLLNPMDGSFTNGFNGTADSLTAGFACDLAPECESGGGAFRLSLTAIPNEQPVPEPGTLAMLGVGALAALARRRSRKRS